MRAASAMLLALCCTTSVNAATVASVGDGDTIRVSEGSRRITVRLACIDAPESSQRPWGARSTVLLRQLTPVGSEVSLRVQTTDRYGSRGELLNYHGNEPADGCSRPSICYRRYLRRAMHRDISSLRVRQSFEGKVSVRWAFWHHTSLGLQKGKVVVQIAQAVLGTAARHYPWSRAQQL